MQREIKDVQAFYECIMVLLLFNQKGFRQKNSRFTDDLFFKFDIKPRDMNIEERGLKREEKRKDYI